MYERVSGPYGGYFVAVYACEMGELGERYLGFYKIWADKPDSYWGSKCLMKGCCLRLVDQGGDALAAAEADARHEIEYLPPVSELQAAREQRPLYWLELQELKETAI